MKRYKAYNRWNFFIEEVEITSETDSFVMRSQGGKWPDVREKKETAYHRYFDTMQEALDYEIHRVGENLEASKRETSRLNSILGQLEKQKRQLAEPNNKEQG